jgi:hypothetical protein
MELGAADALGSLAARAAGDVTPKNGPLRSVIFELVHLQKAFYI